MLREALEAKELEWGTSTGDNNLASFAPKESLLGLSAFSSLTIGSLLVSLM